MPRHPRGIQLKAPHASACGAFFHGCIAGSIGAIPGKMQDIPGARPTQTLPLVGGLLPFVG